MKNNILKKFIFPPFVFIYDIATLFHCCISTLNIIDNFFFYKMGVDSLHIPIGRGATLIFTVLLPTLFIAAIQIIFVVITLFTAVLLTIAVFKKQIKLKFNILFLITSVASLFIFILFPAVNNYTQAYMNIRQLYVRFGTTPLVYLKYVNYLHITISLAVIILSVLLLINNKKLKTQKCETIGE